MSSSNGLSVHRFKKGYKEGVLDLSPNENSLIF